VVVALGFLVIAAHAAAADTSPSVDRQAWVATGPLAPPVPQPANIYVSVVAGQEQARALLHIEPGDISDAQLGRSTVVLTEASDGIRSDQGDLAACVLTAPFAGSGQVGGAPPGEDCTVRTTLSRAVDGTWSLDLGVLANAVVRTGFGVSVFPSNPAPPATYTVSFDTARTRIDVAADEPVVATDDATEPAAAFEAPPAEPLGLSPLGNAFVPAEPAGPSVLDASPQPAAPAPSGVAARAVRPRTAGGPAPVFLLLPMAFGASVLWARGRWLPVDVARGRGVATAPVVRAAAWAALLVAVLLFKEVTVYRLGLVGIVFIGAIGLHILVNWGGELSLAHAGFVGLPAFAVAQVSTHAGISPILVVPFGVVVGALLGSVVAIPALRARGLQVALVTLGVAIAINRFFFARTWVVGPAGGLSIPTPSFIGLDFRTSRGLFPVLAVLVLIAAVAARALLNSKVGRALSFVRTNHDAAAAAGIPVAAYRAAAYAIAGAFAGLAGSAYILWVQRVSPRAFPIDLGFTYLVIAVLAGKGGLGGLALSSLLLEGGQVFSIIPQSIALYLGPIALIYNVTRYQEGFNGLLRETGHRAAHWKEAVVNASRRTTIRIPVVIGAVVVIAGFGALALAWYHAGNTDQVWIQNQEIVSGGLGGLALVVFGSMLLVRDALINGRAVIASSTTQPNEGEHPDLAA
jgi:branched-chain amino acid transport system permease protein